MPLGVPNVFAQNSNSTTTIKPTQTRPSTLGTGARQGSYATNEGGRYAPPTQTTRPPASIAPTPTVPWNGALPFNPAVISFDPYAQPLIPADPTGDAQSSLLQLIWDANLRRSQAAKGADAGSLRAGYDADMARLGLKDKEIGINREALGRQNPLIDELYAGREGQRAGTETYLGKIKGQSQKDYDSTLSLLDEELTNLGFTTKLATSRQQGAAAANGATNTTGNTESLGEIAQQDKMGRLTLANQREGAKSSYTREMASIDKQYGDIGFQRRMDNASTAEDRSKIFDQMKLLDLQAEEVGISRTELAAKLSSGLGKINSSYGDLDQLLGALTSQDPTQINAALEWFNKAYAAGSAGK